MYAFDCSERVQSLKRIASSHRSSHRFIAKHADVKAYASDCTKRA